MSFFSRLFRAARSDNQIQPVEAGCSGAVRVATAPAHYPAGDREHTGGGFSETIKAATAAADDAVSAWHKTLASDRKGAAKARRAAVMARVEQLRAEVAERECPPLPLPDRGQ